MKHKVFDTTVPGQDNALAELLSKLAPESIVFIGVASTGNEEVFYHWVTVVWK